MFFIDYYSEDIFYTFFLAKNEDGSAGGETDEDRAAPVLGLHRKHHLQLPDSGQTQQLKQIKLHKKW